ncbi:hypothetical protein Tco_0383013 [Tanacetum coccineum]
MFSGNPSRRLHSSTWPPSGLKGLLHMLNATVIPTKLWFRWISFDYRVTLGFVSIGDGLDQVNPVIRLPLERGISRVIRLVLGIVGINHYDVVALPSNFKQESNEPLHLAWERFNDSLYNCPEHKINEHEQLQIFYQGLDTETRRKVDFKGSILRMTPAAEIKAIIELSKHSLSWYKEGDSKNNNLNHKYKRPDEGKNSKLEETLRTLIEETRRKHSVSENLFRKVKKNYDKTFKRQASSIKTIESHLGRIAKIIHGRGVGGLPSFTKNKSERLAHAITTRRQSGINKALTDLGASISLIPYSMFLRLNLCELNIEPKSEDYTKPTLFAANMFEGEKPATKIKDLPSHLEYAFLGNNQEFPIIISSLLSTQEKKLHLKVLAKHKSALAWKVADIKGILMEDNFKPVVQP